MNPIAKLFKELTDIQLSILVKEILHFKKKGVLPKNNVFSDLNSAVSQITLQGFGEAMRLTEKEILEEAAKRWLKNLEGKA